ncbi:MAG TPA: Fe-S-containing protein [Nitrospirota bacterium]
MALFTLNTGPGKEILWGSLLVLLSLLSCSRQPAYPPAARVGTDIVIDISGLAPGTPKFFTYQYNGKSINYFALKTGNKVNSFLDACASCYMHKQGYRYDDGHVTCRACGMKFSVYQLEKGLGGCYPIKIEGRRENGKYLIPVATLEAAADKF